MLDRTITISIMIFIVLAIVYTDYSTQAKVYDCTGNLDRYPKAVAQECRELIEEFRRQEEQKGSKIYI